MAEAHLDALPPGPHKLTLSQQGYTPLLTARVIQPWGACGAAFCIHIPAGKELGEANLLEELHELPPELRFKQDAHGD